MTPRMKEIKAKLEERRRQKLAESRKKIKAAKLQLLKRKIQKRAEAGQEKLKKTKEQHQKRAASAKKELKAGIKRYGSSPRKAK